MRLGFDLKQTETGNWGVVEINGDHSGLEGLKGLWGQDYFRDKQIKNYREALRGKSNWSNDVQAEKFYGNVRDFPPLKVADFIETASYTNGTMLRERLSRWWKSSDLSDKKMILARFGYSLKIWQETCEENKKLVQRAKEGSQSGVGLGYYEKILETLYSLWGITRFGLDNEIGLIVETQGVLEEDPFFDLKSLKSFLSIAYEDYPLPSGPKLIRVDEYDLDGNLWLHPDHVLVSDACMIIDDHQGNLQVVRTARNPDDLEGLTGNKILQKEVIPEECLAPYILWTGDFNQILNFIEYLKTSPSSLIRLEDYPYVAVKQKFGSHGTHVHIMPINDVAGIERLLCTMPPGDTLVEGFIPSKPIYNSSNGKMHDGCMRLVIEYMLDVRDQSLVIMNEMGYWRLSPSPLADLETEKEACLKANLTGSRPAIPVEASPEELTEASKIVREILNNLLKKGVLYKAKANPNSTAF